MDGLRYLLKVPRARKENRKTTITRLCKENVRLRRAVKVAKAGREATEARLAGLRAARKALSKKLSGMDGALRRVLLRPRRQKTTITSLARENTGLHRAVKGLKKI